MEIDVAVASQGVEIVRATVVLVHQPGGAVAHDEGGVAAGAVSDARLGVDSDGETTAQFELLLVAGADESMESELGERAFEFGGGEAGQQHLDILRHVLPQPVLIEVVSVDVGDVEVVGSADPSEQFGVEAIVAREHEPRTEELGEEPRIADDRAAGGLDEDPCMSQ